MLGLNRYQWTVLFAAWLGWGFDVFDSLLFNYVAPNAVPTLLGLEIGSPEAKQQTIYWTGLLTAVLLIGWAVGGVAFGWVCDRIGRKRTLMLTMLMYSLGTFACAFATSIEMLLVFRIITALGIGGEWAAGAAMVAEVVPEDKRVEAGALLYTAAPMGLFLATFVNLQVAGKWFPDNPEVSWRYVFLFGLLPAFVAFLVRIFIKEPERWQKVAATTTPPKLSELFGPAYRFATLSGLLMSIVCLLMWWSNNAFIPLISTGLAQTEALALGLDRSATFALIESWKATATNYFNLGGLIGTLLTIPASKLLGRRPMFAIYFLGSAAAIFATYGLDLSPQLRLAMYFFIGLTVFGVFGSFTYYLPELFPTRLRGTGSGFCYNFGRIFASGGPFLVGYIASQGLNAFSTAMAVLFYVGFIPLAGLLLMPLVVETRGKALAD
ncbi:MFS transporter [Panacagrimonas sp.]|uniref:MFS transporter n=1 Tax=Panacagrimonas sp. TaxID=2480088 RepID=UPI003B524A83